MCPCRETTENQEFTKRKKKCARRMHAAGVLSTSARQKKEDPAVTEGRPAASRQVSIIYLLASCLQERPAARFCMGNQCGHDLPH
ncbi:hypothetical protein GDO78_011708 [Eleutherodactylus coqui]|uniref:Uncharacterized protein n=1 Tax=Eleutherodactylus coqui TaxID=57060 RepID=A0A8J6K5V5_ELECQ|nr:hypothetical protein GDO78_011708 [Eleutherodactylus coqui]